LVYEGRKRKEGVIRGSKIVGKAGEVKKISYYTPLKRKKKTWIPKSDLHKDKKRGGRIK